MLDEAIIYINKYCNVLKTWYKLLQKIWIKQNSEVDVIEMKEKYGNLSTSREKNLINTFYIIYYFFKFIKLKQYNYKMSLPFIHKKFIYIVSTT